MSFSLRLYFSALILLSFFYGCERSQNSKFTKHNKGFHYQLISYNTDLKKDNTRFAALLDLNYLTQNDSVFWDSKSDYDDKYFMYVNPAVTGNLIETYLQLVNEGDSVNLLIPKSIFFKQQFATSKIPDFTLHDSIVKVNMKVKKLFNPTEVDSLVFHWAKKEKDLITAYLLKNNISSYFKDSLNVYWLNGKPDFSKAILLKDRTVSIDYKGYLLNGKQFDESPEKWLVNTATPDQMLKGLNYVIKFLNSGENTKIILPSYLAFGELGTGNIIPPYTPLLYEISINNIVN